MSISTNYISDFLRQHKILSLEKIGIINITQSNETGEGEAPQPEIFTYDKNAETTPEFLEYLAEITHKPLPIITSDLEYFLDESRQLMNIGSKPLVIEGYGYIHSKKFGGYEFSILPPEGFKEPEKSVAEDKYATAPSSASTNYAERRTSKRTIGIWIGVLLVIGIIAYGAYYIQSTGKYSLFKSVDSTAAAKKEIENQPKHDSETANAISQLAQPAPAKANGYKFIIQTFIDSANCNKRIKQLESYGNVVSKDMTTVNGAPLYRLFVAVEHANAADTARIKDSLRTYYGHSVSVE